MPISQLVLVYSIGAVLIVLALMAFRRKQGEKVLGFGKATVGWVVLLAGLFLVLGQYGTLSGLGVTFSAANLGTGGGTNLVPSQGGSGFYQPTATYAAKDKFASTAISGGTSHYKVNALPETTTAYSNVNSGDTVTYWLDNSTYYVAPKTLTVGSGVNPFVNDGWNNGSVTLTVYDTINRVTVSALGNTNTTMGANAQVNHEITYQGTAKKSAGPFGGVMVAEYNSTISSVTCTGPDLLTSNPFTVTYTVGYTAHTYKVFAYGPTLDDGSGSPKKINCQFQNGATAAGTGALWYYKFFSANYYASNDGRILLDVEKVANQDTARTQLNNVRTTTGFWG